MTGRIGTTATIALCPECRHPWSVHSYDGCGAGRLAPVDERCQCMRPIPALPGEDVDAAVARLGEVTSAEMTRLLSGSRAVDRLQEIVATLVANVVNDLLEMDDMIAEIDERLVELAEASAESEVQGLTQQEMRAVIAALGKLIGAAISAASPIRRIAETLREQQ